MAILITGGAGFIGSHLAEEMQKQTGELAAMPRICLDNFNDYYDPKLKRANAEAISKLPGTEVVEGDFCDAAFVESLFAEHGFRYIVHLGAYAGVRVSVEQPLVYQQNNVGGTLVLLEAARKYPVERFALASSSTVYGKGAKVPFSEDEPLGVPASPYGATKRSAELLGLTYAQLHGVPVVCLRPFSVYGPRLRPDLALTIFTAAIAHGRSFPLFGDGSIKRDFTHVSDICRGILSSLVAESVVGETINLGHSEPIAMRKVIELLEGALGKTAILDHRPERPEDLPITFANLEKARRLLGYRPIVPVEQGIEEFCDWYRRWNQL